MKIPKNWVGRGCNVLKHLWWKLTKDWRENTELARVRDFRIFIFSLSAIMMTDTVFGKSNSGNLFFLTVLGTAKLWS